MYLLEGPTVKLLRVGPAGHETPAILAEDDRLLDLSGLTADIDGRFLSGGGVERARRALAAGILPELDASGCPRIGAPVARPGKVVCIGLNYRDHAEETGATLPSAPGGVHEGPGHGGRPVRRGAHPPPLGEDRLGGRAGRGDRPPDPLPGLPRGGAGLRRRLRGRQRRLRARVPARVLRPVGQGQVLRDVQPVRPLAGHPGRGRRSAVARAAAVGQRRASGRTATPRT